MIPNACVVEVIERVPDADVAIVAARVGERLGMPQERVRQLIDGRTGPITRALRPEKADAIAQTFEAAGVRVVIRAADADEIDEARPAGAAAAPTEAPAQAAPEAEPAAEDPADLETPVAAESEDEPAPEDEPGLEPEPTFDDEPQVEEPQVDEPRTEDEPASEPPTEAEPVFGQEIERFPEPGIEPALESESDAEPEPDAEPELEPTFDHETDLEPEPEPAGDDDLVAGPDAPSEQGLAREVAYIFATGEAPAWRGPSEDLDAPRPGEEAWTDDEDGDPLEVGGPGGVMDVLDMDDVSDDGDDAAHEARGEVARAVAARAQDAFPPVGGWDAEGAGAWSTRRGTADADGPAGAASRRPEVPEYAIGRASRRPRDGAAESRAPERAGTPEAPPIDVPIDVQNDGEEPAAAFADAPLAPRPVPTAWRGLGGAEAGPARPPSARLPRRADAYDEPRFTFEEPPVRRRVLMLAALGVAVVLFVLAQWWVASRAGAAGLDPFDAYRRGEFAAARAVWDADAAAGDPSARFMLGYLAEAGLGAPWSARTAAGWYRAAAELGHAEAMWRLARLYEVGLGVGPDTLEARRWYRAAAEAGHAEAAFAWGRIVLHDAGVALGAGAAPQVAAATAAEAANAFGRAAELGWHEAAPYAAAFGALVVEAP